MVQTCDGLKRRSDKITEDTLKGGRPWGGGVDNLTHDGDFEEQRSHNYKGNVKSLMEIKQERDYSKTRF